MKAGEIWLAQLDPALGSEIKKTRPCVVISPDDMNAHLRTVIVAPMTTGSRPARFRVALRFQGKQGLIVLDQIRTLPCAPRQAHGQVAGAHAGPELADLAEHVRAVTGACMSASPGTRASACC